MKIKVGMSDFNTFTPSYYYSYPIQKLETHRIINFKSSYSRESEYKQGVSSAITGALWGIPIGIFTGLVGQSLDYTNKQKAFKRWGLGGFLLSTALGYYFGVQKHHRHASLKRRTYQNPDRMMSNQY